LPSEWWPKIAENANKIALVDGNQVNLIPFKIFLSFYNKLLHITYIIHFISKKLDV